MSYNLQNSDLIKGNSLMILLNGEPVGFATNHQLSKTWNVNEVSAKDFGDGVGLLMNSKTYELTTSNLYSLAGYQKLNNIFEYKQEITVYFGQTNYNQTSTQESIVGVQGAQGWSATGYGESGKGYIISLNVVAGSGDTATFEATIRINGTMTATGATGNVSPTGTQS